MVLLSDVTKVYPGRTPVHALRGITLTIRDAEMVAIMGPSGSGKSTLLNLIGGLDVPSSGQVVVEGQDLAGLSEERRSVFRRGRVAFVFQAYHLMPTLTCAQNIALPLFLHGVRRQEIATRVARVLDDVGLTSRAHHLPDELSGGERQRVAIGRALVTNPSVLLADEPTGNLDTATGTQILELLRAIHRDRNATLLMVTHDSRAASWCERVVRLRDGGIDSESDA